MAGRREGVKRYVSRGSEWSKDDPPLCVVCGEIAVLDWPVRGILTCDDENCIAETVQTECDKIEFFEREE